MQRSRVRISQARVFPDKLPIHYVRTADQVRIAFTSVGDGLPVVVMPSLPISHIQLEWQNPSWRSWLESLAQNRRLIRYDCRGSGLSDNLVSDFSLDAQLLDLESVVDCLGLEEFAIFAQVNAGPVAIAYSAHHPDRVSHLILWNSFARTSDYTGSPHIQAIRRLVDDWELFTETLAYAWLGWSAGGEARRIAAFIRRCVVREIMLTAMEGICQFDVTDLLPRVTSTALVLQRQQFLALGTDVARDLASEMPNAEMLLLDGAAGCPYVGDPRGVVRSIKAFLDGRLSDPKPVGVVKLFTEEPSARELEILQLLSVGFSNKRISEELFITLSTVKTHLSHLYAKLEAESRTTAVAKARQLNLIQ